MKKRLLILLTSIGMALMGPGLLSYATEVTPTNETEEKPVYNSIDEEDLYPFLYGCFWDNMTVEDKKSILSQFVQEYCEDLGVELPGIVYKKLDATILAQTPFWIYTDGTVESCGYIEIDESLITASGTLPAFTLAHECRHLYQLKHGTLTGNYIEASSDYAAYASQFPEVDAEQYADIEEAKYEEWKNKQDISVYETMATKWLAIRQAQVAVKTAAEQN